MAYVSSWDDAGNIPSMHFIARLQAEQDIVFPLTINAETSSMVNNTARLAEYTRLLSRGAGDRVESHTVFHMQRNKKYTEDLLHVPDEYTVSQRYIQDTFGCAHGTTLTYPHGKTPTTAEIKTLVAQHYTAARSTSQGLFTPKSDLYKLPCIIIEGMSRQHIEKAAASGAVLIAYGHGVQGVSGWNPVPQYRLRQHIQDLKALRDDIWFTTLPEVVAYLRQTKQVSVPDVVPRRCEE